MAYTNVPTVSVGDLYTADNFNTYLRDNFGAGVPDKFTAKGDIAFGEGADTIGILAVGTDGQWLEADSAETLGAKWADPGGFYGQFTFGSWTCATLSNTPFDELTTDDYINDFPVKFGLPCGTYVEAVIATVSVLNASTYAPGAGRYFSVSNGTADFIKVPLFGDVALTSGDTSYAWNTQTGIFMPWGGYAAHLFKPGITAVSVTITVWGYY